MHDSIRELARLKIRSKIYSFFLGIGVISITFAIIIGLGKDDPLEYGTHYLLILGGFVSTILGMMLYQNEERFAQRYDMTHLLDIDDQEVRFEAYLEHLSEWIATDMDQYNPTRERGSDPSGPDWGKTDFKLGHEPVRRDALVEGGKYTGMEGELTSGELMVAEANTEYADMAQKRWEKAEANDSDLIEYGVERLGDLVKTDYFDKNAEDGAFSKAAKIGDDSPVNQ
jgi:hypothetical protein